MQALAILIFMCNTDILKIDIVPQCCIFIGLVQRKKSFAPYPLNVSSVPSGTI